MRTVRLSRSPGSFHDSIANKLESCKNGILYHARFCRKFLPRFVIVLWRYRKTKLAWSRQRGELPILSLSLSFSFPLLGQASLTILFELTPGPLVDSFTAGKGRSLHFCGWISRKRVWPEGTREYLAPREDKEEEVTRRRKMESHGWEREFYFWWVVRTRRPLPLFLSLLSSFPSALSSTRFHVHRVSSSFTYLHQPL